MEHQRIEKPLSFGEILDVIFRTIKENFSKLFLIMLIFMGPLELLKSVAKTLDGVSLLRAPNSSRGFASLLDNVQQAEMQNTMFDSIYLFLLVFIFMPLAAASLTVATEQIRKQEPLHILAILKRGCSRYWALLGGILVNGLIMVTLLTALIVTIIASLAISGGAGAFTGFAAGPPVGFGTPIVVIIVLSLFIFCGFIYLLTRWSFFFPAIVFDKVSPGLGKSWRLTRGHFWRLLGLYIVVSIIVMIITAISQIAVYFFLGNSVLASLLISLVALPISLTSYIAYAVIYFDLRVRNEGMDLNEMIEAYPDNTTSSPTLDGVPTKPEG